MARLGTGPGEVERVLHVLQDECTFTAYSPFQLVSSDYFAYAGRQYLLVIDRYSGWLVVGQCKDGTAGELVKMLRRYFST